MKKLAILLVLLLLVSVVGCSSGDSITGPDTNDDAQIVDVAQKADASKGDPTTGLGGPGTPGDPIGGWGPN